MKEKGREGRVRSTDARDGASGREGAGYPPGLTKQKQE